jgi:hypothetical protein
VGSWTPPRPPLPARCFRERGGGGGEGARSTECERFTGSFLCREVMAARSHNQDQPTSPAWAQRLKACNTAWTTAPTGEEVAQTDDSGGHHQRQQQQQQRGGGGCEDGEGDGGGVMAMTIPPFYVAKPARDSLAARLRKHAMQVFIERQSAKLLSSDVLRQLFEWPQQRVNYEQFRAKGKLLGGVCRAAYFRASTFLSFERTRGGQISVPAFVGYVVRREELLRSWLHLSCYDSDQDGFLTVADVNHFVSNAVQSLPVRHGGHHRSPTRGVDVGGGDFNGGEDLAAATADAEPPVDGQFLPFYVLTAVSKFFFFLDPNHHQKIRVRKLATSPEFAEFEELRQQLLQGATAGSDAASSAATGEGKGAGKSERYPPATGGDDDDGGPLTADYGGLWPAAAVATPPSLMCPHPPDEGCDGGRGEGVGVQADGWVDPLEGEGVANDNDDYAAMGSDVGQLLPSQGGNWFSPRFAVAFYRYYLYLDVDHNGASCALCTHAYTRTHAHTRAHA